MSASSGKLRHAVRMLMPCRYPACSRGQRVTYAAPPLSDSEEELVPRLLFPSGSRSKRALPRRATAPQSAPSLAPPPLQRTTRTRQAACAPQVMPADEAGTSAARARTIDTSLPRPNLFSRQIAARESAARSSRDSLHSELHARMAAWSDDEDEEDDGPHDARVVHLDMHGGDTYAHSGVASHDFSSPEDERGQAALRSGRPRPPTELPHWESQDVFERHVRPDAGDEDAHDAADEAHAKRRRVL